MKNTKALKVIGRLQHLPDEMGNNFPGISQFNSPEGHFSVRYFDDITIPLGNYYYKDRTEIFIVLKGSGKVILQYVDPEFLDPNVDMEYINNDQNVLNAEPEVFQVKVDSVVFVPPYMAHVFLLNPGSEMICFSTKAFNEGSRNKRVWVLEQPEYSKQTR